MHFGIHVFPTESSFQPDDLARAAEERGLDSVWFSEHTHIPVRFLNAPGRTSPLAAHLWQTYDLFVAMTLAVAATKTIKVGTGVALILERDPIILATETATLDRVSQGRFIFGVGAGWIEPEMADHGVVYRTRYQQLKEHIQAIKAIWMTEESEFHGTFVNFDPMKAFPKPYQRPHPPIIMGGGGKSRFNLLQNSAPAGRRGAWNGQRQKKRAQNYTARQRQADVPRTHWKYRCLRNPSPTKQLLQTWKPPASSESS